jgi:hypothetical protein
MPKLLKYFIDGERYLNHVLSFRRINHKRGYLPSCNPYGLFGLQSGMVRRMIQTSIRAYHAIWLALRLHFVRHL